MNSSEYCERNGNFFLRLRRSEGLLRGDAVAEVAGLAVWPSSSSSSCLAVSRLRSSSEVTSTSGAPGKQRKDFIKDYPLLLGFQTDIGEIGG